MHFISRQYKESRIFYKENLRIIFPVTILLFIISLAFFSIFLSMNAGAATRFLLRLGNGVNNSMNTLGFFPMICRNIYTGFYLIASGILPFLFIPSLFAIYNGGIIGIMLGSSAISNITPGLILANILPYGIFLIPAMLLAAACGIYVCKCVTLRLLHKQNIPSFKRLAVEIVRIYVFIILPLMLFAAFMQVFITPLILRLY